MSFALICVPPRVSCGLAQRSMRYSGTTWLSAANGALTAIESMGRQRAHVNGSVARLCSKAVRRLAAQLKPKIGQLVSPTSWSVGRSVHDRKTSHSTRPQHSRFSMPDRQFRESAIGNLSVDANGASILLRSATPRSRSGKRLAPDQRGCRTMASASSSYECNDERLPSDG